MSTSSAPLLRAYRSAWMQIAGWFVVVSATLGIVDAVFRATSGGRISTVLFALGAVAIAWVWALRPVVRERQDALLVVNPLRTAVMPWGSITDVDSADVVTVTAGEVKVRCFAVPRSFRPLARPAPGAPAAPSDPYARAMQKDPIVRFEALRETLARPDDGPASYEWSPVALAALGVGLGLILVAVLLVVTS